MIEDTSSAAWYQSSMVCLDGFLIWTVKECIENFEYHLIRKLNFYDDFFHSL